jgi:hypothetical protein
MHFKGINAKFLSCVIINFNLVRLEPGSLWFVNATERKEEEEEEEEERGSAVFKKAEIMFGQRESYERVNKKGRENQNARNVREGAELDRPRERQRKKREVREECERID